MRSFWIIFNIILFLSVSFEAVALSSVTRTPTSEKSQTCRYITGDVGTIIGKGATKHEAFADAATKCFDRRVQMYEQVRRQAVDMERGQDFIDSCANLTCS